MDTEYIMTTNIVKQKCPDCGTMECVIQGAVIAGKEFKEGDEIITKFKSYNLYKCLKHHHKFLVERTQEEQELTEKYIVSKKIKLD